MENFNSQFKNKKLKKQAWFIANALTDADFDTQVSRLNNLTENQNHWNWLSAVECDLWSLVKSPVPRFGILTSNNVESVDSRLSLIQKLPVLEIPLSIKKFVCETRFKDFCKASLWEHNLTKYAIKKITNNYAATEIF
ncbi:hypothetical protein BB559_002391 [Furculomyces boomerangus]|uniref:Uncharacterized protein n=1 Tax=Furculomyces boomerangus TaxID=61424 RepID=A0A2T9YVS0_9FUNG|nr:hypothetical protein BB559_002391 [Furculomyces boomerangus]